MKLRGKRKWLFGILCMFFFGCMAYILRDHVPALTAFYGAFTPVALAFLGFQAWIDRNGKGEK